MTVPTSEGDASRSTTAWTHSVALTASNQSRVLGYIRSHPGVHLRRLSRDLDLAIGDTQYQVSRLESSGSIRSFRRGLYRFFFPSDLFGARAEIVLSALSQDTPRELLLNVVSNPGSSQEDLCEALGLSAPTISWHMKRLAELGLVIRTQQGRKVAYSAETDSLQIADFLRSYHPSVWERWSSRLTDLVLAMSDQHNVK